MKKKFSAFCIAGTNSGCGKTTITTALIWALRKRGLNIAPFKCGPDYIDPSYHSAASGNPAVNLDTWIMNKNVIRDSFLRNSNNADIAILEGVMGLFDGASSSQSGSTAECAITLNLPVILIVNASGMGASIAPLVYGFTKFNPQVKICGVIANKIGSENHRKILKEALEKNSLPPLIGAFPKNYKFHIPERHLGLLPWIENKNKDFFFDGLAESIEKNLDIDKILQLSEIQYPNSFHPPNYPPPKYLAAIAKDEAFNFYYHDNIHFLRMAGFKIIEISPIRDKKLPEKLDLLYLGGGFPEIFAKQLSANCDFRKSVANFAKSGGKIYAECGGFMYLSTELQNSEGEIFPMCNVIPGKTRMTNRSKALGYREVKTLHQMPFCQKNAIIRGHEFHWSEFIVKEKLDFLFECKDSNGKIWLDGVKKNNVFASYIHLHFLSIFSENLKA